VSWAKLATKTGTSEIASIHDIYPMPREVLPRAQLVSLGVAPDEGSETSNQVVSAVRVFVAPVLPAPDQTLGIWEQVPQKADFSLASTYRRARCPEVS
jgi:hypothetical protein